MAVETLEACRVRFDNGHEVRAFLSGSATPRPRRGQTVRVVLAHDEMRGWRL